MVGKCLHVSTIDAEKISRECPRLSYRTGHCVHKIPLPWRGGAQPRGGSHLAQSSLPSKTQPQEPSPRLSYRTLSTLWGERARVRGEGVFLLDDATSRALLAVIPAVTAFTKFPSFGGEVRSTGVVLTSLSLLSPPKLNHKNRPCGCLYVNLTKWQEFLESCRIKITEANINRKIGDKGENACGNSYETGRKHTFSAHGGRVGSSRSNRASG